MNSSFLGRALLLAIAVAAGGLTLPASNAKAAQLVVQNSSFEDDILGEGGFTNNTLSGWQLVNELGYGAGVYNPLDTPPYYFGESVPDGVNIAYSNGATLFQSLGSTLDANTLYSLAVSVGARPEPSVRFPGYGIQLWAGDLETGSLLAEVLSDDSTVIAPGTFQTISLAYAASNNATFDTALLGKNLGISLFPLNARNFSGVSQVNFDSVSLDAALIESLPTPAPSPELPVDPEPSPLPTSAPELPPAPLPIPELPVGSEPPPTKLEEPIEIPLVPPVEPSIIPVEPLPVEVGGLPTENPVSPSFGTGLLDIPSPSASSDVAIAPPPTELESAPPLGGDLDPQTADGTDQPSPELALPPPSPAAEGALPNPTRPQTSSSASVPEPSGLIGLGVALALGWRAKRRD